MLIGFDKNETWDRIWYRFKLMVERDIEPYPMVFHQRGQKPRADLKCFQRWVNLGLYRFIPWNEYRRQTKSDESVAPGTAYTPREQRSNKRQSPPANFTAEGANNATDPRDQHKH